MPDLEMRARVQRLLDGDVRINDLDRIFLYLRDHSGGRAAVREVGDFVAHRRDRNKGPVTQRVRDFFVILDYLEQRARQPTLPGVPANVIDIARASLMQMDDAKLMKHTNRSRSALTQILKNVGPKFRSIGGARVQLSGTASNTEREVLDGLLNNLVVGPAFTSDTVFEELQACLEAKKCLAPTERAAFEKTKSQLGLYVVALMNQCSMKIDSALSDPVIKGHDSAKLVAATGAGNRIEVKAIRQMPMGAQPISVIFPIYVTDIDAETHCAPDVLSEQLWDFEMELDSGLLVRL